MYAALGDFVNQQSRFAQLHAVIHPKHTAGDEHGDNSNDKNELNSRKQTHEYILFQL
jgi:hypothetical protein